MLTVLDAEINISSCLNSFAKISALTSPINLIPREYINLSNDIFFELLIELIKLEKDNSPHPSNSIISDLKFSRLNISSTLFIYFSLNNSLTCFSPNPSIFKLFLLTK